jgi:hypothetical protein
MDARRSYRGPLGRGEGAKDQAPQGAWARTPMPFRQGRSPVEKPLRPFTHLPGRTPGKRALWGALLFGYFLLGTQEKVTRSFQDRKRFALKALEQEQWIPVFAGMTAQKK